MSDTCKEDRPKLKAKRFSKFEPSSSKPTVVNKKDFIKQGSKRFNTSEIDDRSKPFKQIKLHELSSYNVPPSTTKNLANNRLKKLQEQIQSELKAKNANNLSNSVPTCDKSIKIPLHKNNDSLIKPSNLDSALQNVHETIFKKSDVSASRHLPEPKVNRNLDHSFSPPNRIYKKNLANERLQNIKNKLKNTCLPSDSTEIGTRDTKANTSESPHCSTSEIKENKTVRGLKRNISNITNTYDCDIIESSSKRLEVEQNVPSTLVSTNSCGINTSISGDIDKLHHSGLSDQSLLDTSIIDNATKCDTDIVPPCTPVSQRLNKKNNTSTESSIENSSCVQNEKTSATNSTPVSQRLSYIKETNTLLEGDKNDSNFKSPIDAQTLQKLSTSQQNTSHTPTSVQSRSDNFMTKMAMTATWIRNHQDISNIDNRADNSSPNVSGNSLNNSRKEISNKPNFDYETEDMEWTNAEPDEEVIVTKEDIQENSKANIEVRKDPEKLKDVCIVVDTNVFISGLSKIHDIINLKTTGSFKPLIYIPWMVITELDYMKDSCSDSRLKNNILNSVKFINRALEENNPRVIGQTVFEVDKQKYVGPSPDDKIISCCLQVAEKYETVILLSNDTNLKNKAMINNLLACSMNEVMVKIMSKLAKNTKSQKIMHKMGVMCSRVICECAKAAYGKVWMKMDMLSNAPWSLVECIKRFKKYWGAVFREMLMKQFTKTLDELQHLLQHNKCICDDSEEFVEFMKLCVTFCIFLKDIEECRGFVEITLNDITKLG